MRPACLSIRHAKIPFEPCIPTGGTKVPAGPDWFHEIKHDGYRLIVQRDGKRVRLFTRNGHDWTDRYPLIVEAALKNPASSFVIDGEAVLLGVDGISDYNGLHSRRHNDEVQLYAFAQHTFPTAFGALTRVILTRHAHPQQNGRHERRSPCV